MHNTLSDTFAVAPQITPEDLDNICAAGFDTIICNRPDAEVPPAVASGAIAAACSAAGIAFVFNPLPGGMLSLDHVTAQRAAMDASKGPVLAYCASGTRSAALWALAEAGLRPTDEILAATAAAGYPLDGLRGQIDALSSR